MVSTLRAAIQIDVVDIYLLSRSNQGYTCNTGYLFSSPGAENPLSEYGCLDGRTTSYYRTVPASIVAAPTTDSCKHYYCEKENNLHSNA
jgi:hypothetical protein